MGKSGGLDGTTQYNCRVTAVALVRAAA